MGVSRVNRAAVRSPPVYQPVPHHRSSCCGRSRCSRSWTRASSNGWAARSRSALRGGRDGRERGRERRRLLRDRERRGRRQVGGEERGRLGPGDYFGDIALIDMGARTASIRAERRAPLLRPDLLGLPPARRERRAHRMAVAAGDGEAPTRGRSGRADPSSSRSSRARAGSPLSATASIPASTRPPKRTQRTPSSSQTRNASPGALPSNVVRSTAPSPVTTRSARATRSRKPVSSNRY